MNQKIEHSLRRAVGQLPRPDYQAVAQAPVQRMEVHDYVTRQEMVVRPSRPRLLAAVVLAVCVLALCVGLTVYFQFFQIYSVVDLRVNPAFAIQLNRQDQVRGVQALNDDAEPILEGRSYKGWALEAVVSALVDDLIVNGYLDAEGDKVDVAVNSQSAEHSRELRSYVEGLLDQRLAGLSNTGTQEDPANSTPAPEGTTAAIQTPAPVVTPPATPVPAPPADPVLSWGEDLAGSDYFYYDEIAGKTWLMACQENGTYLRCDPAAVRGLKGIRVDAGVKVLRGGRERYACRGDVLFTESGISGDAVFRASSYAEKGDTVLIDFLPDVPPDRLAASVGAGEDGLLCVVNNGLGRQLFRRAAGDRARVLALLKAFPLAVTGTLGFDYAQATRGGIPLSETDGALMSVFRRGLYFAGEILNVDGACGGFNLHWAWASAHHICEAIR